MRRAIALLIVLLLAMLHAPSSAQALVSSLLPDLFAIGTTGPTTLLVTGLALLSLGRVIK